MAFVKGLFGGLAGMLGYQTLSEYDAKDFMGMVLGALQSKTDQLKGKTHSDPEVKELAKQISEMQRWLQRDRQQLTIVTKDGKGGGWTTFTVVVLAAGGVVVYLRFWRGWHFTDMMYVTRGGMQQFRTQVAEAMKSVKENVERSMSVVGEKLGMLQRKQDDLMKGQRELGEQMDTRLEEVNGNIGQVHGDVRLLQGEINDVRQRIQVGNQGLFVLIQAVSEMMPAVGFRNNTTQHHLQAYLKDAPALLGLPPMTSSQRVPQGLECLSGSNDNPLLFPPATTRSLSWAVDDSSSANTSASGRQQRAQSIAVSNEESPLSKLDPSRTRAFSTLT